MILEAISRLLHDAGHWATIDQSTNSIELSQHNLTILVEGQRITIHKTRGLGPIQVLLEAKRKASCPPKTRGLDLADPAFKLKLLTTIVEYC